ncbi:hypothetical protein AB5J49_08055 [Streptomyces sp. R28]|uniref:Uncharacterized protein n=1 Tax=Streptomyces sp. R28 TaxID=3238628 RepID=A0AB39PQC6_9ACTN
MTTATTPTSPLSPAAEAALHRLEAAFSPVLAEQRSIEHRLARLAVGESATVNGTEVTVVSLAVAEALTVHETAAVRAAELAAKAASGVDLPALDVRAWGFAEELMAGARATLAKAGRLDLIGVS